MNTGVLRSFTEKYYFGEAEPFMTEKTEVIPDGADLCCMDPREDMADAHELTFIYKDETYKALVPSAASVSFYDSVVDAKGGVVELSVYTDREKTQLFAEPSYGYIGTGIDRDMTLYAEGKWFESYPDIGL
jgi:hypothetical protein